MTNDKSQTDLRRTQRIALTPKAELSDGVTSYKAIIQDVSDEGLLLVCTRAFKPGQRLRLKFQLFDGPIIECVVEVRHSNDLGTGVEIATISKADQNAYTHYIQEFVAQRLRRKPLGRL
ncbi:MAG: PilZ domain-containing protein [Betaproteobacteria bacterium]|nr:PilZ domain-containing protein [Betaproteobacteria bacterium]